MKTFLRMAAAAALFMIPGISAASSLDYVQSGSQCTVLFDPNGSGIDNLPASFFYRSYNCRIGSKPVVIPNLHVVTPPPPTGGTTPPPPPVTTDISTPPPDGGTTPTITTDVPPPTGNSVPPVITDGETPAVPLPASSEMAGVGLAIIALASWQRSRSLARA